MKHAWDLPRQTSLASDAPRWNPVEVLIEYGGPQLVILEDISRRYLALAVDDGSEFIRWIAAPLSHVEEDGLLSGGNSVRAFLTKPAMLVIDYAYTDQSTMRVWRVGPKEIPSTAWPDSGVPLPSDICDYFASRRKPWTTQPYFDLGGRNETAIAFGGVSAMTGGLQSVWDAFAHMGGSGRATLHATATATGSLRLLVETEDVALFSRIAERYKELVLASDDPAALNQLLEGSPRLSLAYGNYLKAVQRHGTEVLAHWAGGSAYVSHNVAEGARKAFRPDDGEAVPETREEVSQYTGFFEGYWPTKKSARFKFYDVDADRTYSGQVDATLRRRIEREIQVTLGRSERMYKVQLLVKTQGDSEPSYTLQDFELAEPE